MELVKGDRYFTERWVTQCLVDKYLLPHRGDSVIIWECAAGRGDMARVLVEAGHQVMVSDLDPSELVMEPDPHIEWYSVADGPVDFLADRSYRPPAGAIVTNPPYSGGLSDKFVERALGYLRDPECEVSLVAMLLRTEFASGSRRVHVFEDPDNHFATEIRLIRRPRWDWWLPVEYEDDGTEKKKNGPRHNFSWYVWDNCLPRHQEPTIMWAGHREKKDG